MLFAQHGNVDIKISFPDAGYGEACRICDEMAGIDWETALTREFNKDWDWAYNEWENGNKYAVPSPLWHKGATHEISDVAVARGEGRNMTPNMSINFSIVRFMDNFPWGLQEDDLMSLKNLKTAISTAIFSMFGAKVQMTMDMKCKGELDDLQYTVAESLAREGEIHTYEGDARHAEYFKEIRNLHNLNGFLEKMDCQRVWNEICEKDKRVVPYSGGKTVSDDGYLSFSQWCYSNYVIKVQGLGNAKTYELFRGDIASKEDKEEFLQHIPALRADGTPDYSVKDEERCKLICSEGMGKDNPSRLYVVLETEKPLCIDEDNLPTGFIDQRDIERDLHNAFIEQFGYALDDVVVETKYIGLQTTQGVISHGYDTAAVNALREGDFEAYHKYCELANTAMLETPVVDLPGKQAGDANETIER